MCRGVFVKPLEGCRRRNFPATKGSFDAEEPCHGSPWGTGFLKLRIFLRFRMDNFPAWIQNPQAANQGNR